MTASARVLATNNAAAGGKALDFGRALCWYNVYKVAGLPCRHAAERLTSFVAAARGAQNREFYHHGA